MYTNIFLFGERIFPEYDTCDGLSNSRARPIKLRCVFNKVFLVNHWRDILLVTNGCLSNSYRCIEFCFTLDVNRSAISKIVLYNKGIPYFETNICCWSSADLASHEHYFLPADKLGCVKTILTVP